jgi:hypothetical protein
MKRIRKKTGNYYWMKRKSRRFRNKKKLRLDNNRMRNHMRILGTKRKKQRE